MKVRDFFVRWKKGIERVTPLQQLRAKRTGVSGQVFGVFVGMVVLVTQGLYYWLVLLGFTLFVLLIDLLGIHQQVKQLEKIIER